MVPLIDKDTLVAKIEKLKGKISDGSSYCNGWQHALRMLEIELNTLEVKEVDLDFMLHEYWNISPKICVDCLESATMTKDEMINFAKHFFELGLNTSNPLTWEDVKEVCVQSVLVEIDLGGKISDERHYSEVLKRFKAQKGE